MSVLYEADIRHVRATPVRNEFTYRSYYWYVDLDDLPRLRWPLRLLARFDARDHFSAPEESGNAPTIRAGLDALLAEHGIDLRGGRVTMLAHARVFGYVFNPLTAYWCHDEHGDLVCVVAEVHNTYGQRHNYVLRPEAGAAELRTPKQFYVSPFFDVSGDYRMRLPEPDDGLALTISLRREGERPFVATLHGSRQPATTRNLLRAAVRHPWSTLVGSALIRYQGIRLYRKGLPIVPRPAACPHTMAVKPLQELTPLKEKTI